MKTDQRWTICGEYCGHAQPRPVLRFCGAWVASYPTYAAADEAKAALIGATQWVLVRAYGDLLRMYAGDTGYRVTYGADVRTFAKIQEADTYFEDCRAHEKGCNE